MSLSALDQAPGTLVCLFEVASRTFAVEIGKAREARIVVDYTVVPLAPPHVRGLTNLRGAIIPIVDLRVLLDLPPRAAIGHALVVEAHGVRVAIAVDHVIGVEALEEAPELEERHLRRGDGTVPMLDVEGLVESLAVTKEGGA